MSNPIAFLTPINLGKNELQNAVIQNLASAPGTPVAGQTYYNTTSNHSFVYNGSSFEQASGGSGTGTVTSVTLALNSASAWYTIAITNTTTTPAISLTLQTGLAQNTFLATPNGSTGTLGLRTIVAADIPKTLDHTWVTDFDTEVRTSRLDQMAAPTASVSLNSQNITNLLDPTTAQMASTKNYADTHSFGSATVANSTVLIGPGSGGPLAPTWRLLAAGDIPSLTHTSISDFDTQVRTSRLDQMAAPTASVSLNSQKITSLLDPTLAQDAATKNYVDLTIQGLVQKPTAKVATVAALSPANTYSAGVLTATGVGILTVDGYNTVLGDIILVKNEAAPANNGLYTVTTAGTAGVAYVLTRSTTMDSAAEFYGSFVPVDGAGTANANSLWLFNGTTPVVVGTSSVTFVELNKGTDLAGTTNQITITGNVISIATGYLGQTSITTLGTITAGTWTGTSIAVANGGTGATTAANARTNLGVNGMPVPGKYQATCPATATWTITQATHLLASDSSILVQVFNTSTGAIVFPDVTVLSGTVTIAFAVAPTLAQYSVVLIG